MQLTHILTAATISMVAVSSAAPIPDLNAEAMTALNDFPPHDFSYPPRREEIPNNPVHDAEDEKDHTLYPLVETPHLGNPTPAPHHNKADEKEDEHTNINPHVHRKDDMRDNIIKWHRREPTDYGLQRGDLQKTITKRQRPHLAVRSPSDAWPEMIGEEKKSMIGENWSWEKFEKELGFLASG